MHVDDYLSPNDPRFMAEGAMPFSFVPRVSILRLDFRFDGPI